MSLRNARRRWRKLGGEVKDVHRTGEERYTHPRFDRPLTVNKRKKDAPRVLLTRIARLER